MSRPRFQTANLADIITRPGATNHAAAKDIPRRIADLERLAVTLMPTPTVDGSVLSSDTSQTGGVKWALASCLYAGHFGSTTTTSWTGGVSGDWGAFIPQSGSSGYSTTYEKKPTGAASIVGASGSWMKLTIPVTGLWHIAFKVYAASLDGTTERLGAGLMGGTSGTGGAVSGTEIFKAFGFGSGTDMEREFQFTVPLTAAQVVIPSFLRVGSTTTFNAVSGGYGCSVRWALLATG